MASSEKYNLRNPAVKRILQEMREMQKDTSQEFVAEAIEDNIFEWQFVICGPPNTEFEGGIYHGRILLPSEYPFKPPSFMMLTPSGRFEVGKKICLSISERHPEHWQPSWSMRTALIALVAFLPSKGKGAIGSLDHSSEERKQLALKSRSFIPSFGSDEKQAIANRIHATALSREKGKVAKVVIRQSTEDENNETIKSATNVVDLPNSPGGSGVSEALTDSPGSNLDNETASFHAPDASSSEFLLTSESGIDTRGTQLVGNERGWSAALWTVGLLIIAIITKKLLVRAGIDVWSSID